MVQRVPEELKKIRQMSDTCSWRRRNETYLPRSSSDDFVLREESVAGRWPAANAPDPDAPAGLQSDGCFGAGVRGGPLGGREPAPPVLGVHVHDVLAELRSANPHPLQEAEAAQVAAADLALPSLDAVAEPPLADLPQLLEADVLEPVLQGYQQPWQQPRALCVSVVPEPVQR